MAATDDTCVTSGSRHPREGDFVRGAVIPADERCENNIHDADKDERQDGNRRVDQPFFGNWLWLVCMTLAIALACTLEESCALGMTHAAYRPGFD